MRCGAPVARAARTVLDAAPRHVAFAALLLALCSAAAFVYSSHPIAKAVPETSAVAYAPGGDAAAAAPAAELKNAAEGSRVSDPELSAARPQILRRARAEIGMAMPPQAAADPRTRAAANEPLHTATDGTRTDSGAAVGAAAHSLIAAAISGDAARLQTLVSHVPRWIPPHGDRESARRLNAEALALFQNAHYTEAAALFAQARTADEGDIEIRENLGYSLLRAGELAAAERALVSALEISPRRATAWGSLGHVYARRGKHREAVALLMTAYRYSPDREKTLETYARQAETEADPAVRAMLAECVKRLSKTQ